MTFDELDTELKTIVMNTIINAGGAPAPLLVDATVTTIERLVSENAAALVRER